MAKKGTIGRTVVLSSLRAGLAAASTLSPHLAGAGAARLFLSTRRHPMAEWERAQLASARRWQLGSAWGSLAGWTWGPEEAPAVALQHGWEGRAAQLGAFVPPLIAAGFRVVALDGPGHGDSPGRSSSLVALGGALRRLGGSVGPLAGIVAHSGGAVAAIHALSCGLVADRLVCIAPGVDLEAYAREFARMFGLSAAVSRSMRRRIERRVGVSWDELDPRRAAAHARLPLLVIHDRADREAPFAGGESLARAWGARLIATEGLGHTRILRYPQVVAQTTEFLCGSEVSSPAQEVAQEVMPGTG